MSKEPNRRRTTAALTAAVAVAGAAVLAGAPAAHAAVVDVNYACETKIGPKSAVSPVDIKAVKSGSAYTITMSFEKGVSDSPVELPKGVMTPRADLVLGGADSGTLKVKGTPNTAAIPPDTPIRIGTLTGTYTPKKNGRVTFTAGTLTVHALGMDAAVCAPKNNPKASSNWRSPAFPAAPTPHRPPAARRNPPPNSPRPARSTPPWPSAPSAAPSC